MKLLQGVRILELGTWIAVPSATMILADWGADVIKIEDPRGGDMVRGARRLEGVELAANNWFFQWLNRNKRSVAIDLSKESGREAIYKLVQTSDVFISNLLPLALERNGADYESLSHFNPRLIYVSFTGYGTAGKDRNKDGYDYIAFWVRSGIMSRMGEPDTPAVPQGPAFGDMTSGLLLSSAISAALLAREKTGVGQRVDISLYHTGVWILGRDFQMALSTGVELKRRSRKDARNPFWNTYQTKDGRWIALAMPQSDRYWPRFCEAVGREDLVDSPLYNCFERREENRQSLISMMDQIFATKEASEWQKIFSRKGLVFDIGHSISEVIADPQAIENNFFTTINLPSGGVMKTLSNPVSFSETPASIERSAPELGEHTEQILLEVGYSWEDISELKNQQAII